MILTQPSEYEQYMLELINRARANPGQEANRYKIELNQGLASGTITIDPKQPLVFNLSLIDAARNHSQWMLETDTFSHTGVGGSSAGDRMEDAGYVFSGSWTWGENISWKGTTGTPDVNQYVTNQHEGLFKSSGHRRNILNSNFREIGIGIKQGGFIYNNVEYNSVMISQDFAKSGSAVFLTGVAFNDSVIENNFYDVGEGLGGVNVQAIRQSDNQVFSTTTWQAGGYQIELPQGNYDVTFSSADSSFSPFQTTVTIGSENVKVDLDISELPESPQASVIGEVGIVTNLNHNYQTITLENNYINPVIIANTPSFNGNQPVTIRLKDIGSNSFSLKLQEPSNLDGKHINESVSYLVVEAGSWTLADGTIIEAGNFNDSGLIAQGWNQVNFSANFGSQTPAVFSQVQTSNGGDFVRTREKDITNAGFSLAMEEEEKLKNSGHVEENIGWLAIKTGVGDLNGDNLTGMTYQAGYTGDNVTHNWQTVDFQDNLFSETPNLIASLASYDGPDSAGLRYRGLSSQGLQIKVEEDTSRDLEINHTTESVSFLAIQDNGNIFA